MKGYGDKSFATHFGSPRTDAHMTRHTRLEASASTSVEHPSPWMHGVLLVFVGGAAGAWLRHALPELPFNVPSPSLLPNALACLVIGFLHSARQRLRTQAATLGVIGFCGGLSTFSGLALALAAKVSAGEYAQALFAAGLEVLVGVALVLLGARLARRWQGSPV